MLDQTPGRRGPTFSCRRGPPPSSLAASKWLRSVVFVGSVLTITSVEYFGWFQRAGETVSVGSDRALFPGRDPTRGLREPFQVEITAGKDRWRVRYPGIAGVSAPRDDTSSTRDIHVPLGRDVVIVLKSADFIYTFDLPDFGLKEIAVPDLEFRMSLHPTEIGRHALLGEQLCGDPHSDLRGQLVVQSLPDLGRWLRRSVSRPR